ncbi:MAG: asparagine synthase-related protein [Anaerolineae bacterium]|jgi:asparagine synthase (glutamine-hydrolysing)
MSGLVGFVGEPGAGEPRTLVADMARAIRHEDWYQVDLYQGEDFGLGRVSLGFLNPEPQPIWNEDETLCLVMDGEVYDYQDLKQMLMARGHRFRIDNDAEFVLHLYEEFGEEFASQLNGAFVVAIWDTRSHKLRVVNDRFGLQALFYRQAGDRLLFAGHSAAFLADSAYSPQVDGVALAELFSFEHVLGDRTLLAEVKLLSPGSILTFESGQLSLRAYYDFQFVEDHQNHSDAWYIERWGHLMRQAVERRMRGDGPSGVQLSGGLDSRAVLAMIDRRHYPLHTFTFGIPGCDDARFAREVAAKRNTTHHFLELKPDYLRRLAEQGVKLTNGLKSCVHMHVLGTLPETAEIVKILFTGSLGDSIMGSHVQRRLLAFYAPSILTQMLFERYNNCFREEVHPNLFSDEFYAQIKGGVFEEFDQAFAESCARLADNKRSHYSIRQNDRRWVLEGQNLLRSRLIVRTPFYDNDLVDFMLTVPPGLRCDGYLYTRGFIQAAPDLAKVPCEKTGLPLVPCMRDLSIRADQQARWWLRQAGLKWISPFQERPFADYDLWLRTVLRDWVEDILLDHRTLDRGYVRPDYVRTLVERHMRGEGNFARQLGVLLTFELWHRLFLDQQLAG